MSDTESSDLQPKPEVRRKKHLRSFTYFFLLMCLISFAVGMLGANRLLGAGPLEEPKEVWVKSGTTGVALAHQLTQEGVIYDPYSFMLALRLQTSGRDIRAGEYKFTAYQPLQSVIDQMRRGDTILRQFTLPEGRTVAEAVEMLKADPLLTGDIVEVPAEGSLLPETYKYERGDSRASVIARMHAAMEKTVAELWKTRAAELPITSVKEAVTMASIVEKETSRANERARVAGVYYNRLRHSMLLQADPTTVYAITKGSGPLGRAITVSDLAVISPYNTYVVPGLPPGPIANPGRASLIATLQPEKNDYLYFVADGSGGHVFAKTLAEHQQNVAKWRKIEKAAETSAVAPKKPERKKAR